MTKRISVRINIKGIHNSLCFNFVVMDTYKDNFEKRFMLSKTEVTATLKLSHVVIRTTDVFVQQEVSRSMF